MSKFILYNSNLTNVTSFSGNFDNRELSGRPQFTGDFRTTLLQNFSGTKTFSGYGFDSITSVMLSSTNNVNLFDASYTLSSYNFYNELTAVSTNSTPSTSISANYPEISGFPITTYTINNYNTFSITFPTVTATGIVDVIAINAAGYGIFSVDITGTSGITVQ
jgi:hypothetical protein